MLRVELVNLRHAYRARPKAEPVWALKGVDQAFEPGKPFAVLGPRGAGKTTLIRLLAGLMAPSEGRILFDAEDVTASPASRRSVALVDNQPAVYDTLTVRENIAFPLRNRRIAPGEARQRVDETLAMLHLTPRSGGAVAALSTEDRQRVAIGRALVRGPSALMLLDEPVADIPAADRWRLLAEISALQRRTGMTMIYATEDQGQALSFGERTIFLSEGGVLQTGSAAELFDRPRHTAVGRFIGAPGMNILPVSVEGANARLGGQVFDLPSAPNLEGVERLEIGVRPEHVEVGRNGLSAQVVRIDNEGRRRILRARIEGFDIAAMLREGAEVPAETRLSFDMRHLHLYADSWRVELGSPA